jgi:hypothetical protein
MALWAKTTSRTFFNLATHDALPSVVAAHGNRQPEIAHVRSLRIDLPSTFRLF